MKKMAYALALTTGAGLGAGMAAAPMAAGAETVMTPAASGLQLSISAAGVVPSDAALALDVRFEGGSLRLVELLVDGVTVKKKNIATRTSRGHIEFQMEAGLLSEGTHEILVRALDAEGNTATTSTQLRVTPGASGLVKFAFPKNKAMVQGTVPLEIKLDSSIHNPYVSFFVDDNFLALTNYAPFTVNWDSTRVSNGLHTVSVEVYDGDTLAKVKSTSLQLNINNPGGLTTRQNETPDLNKGAKNSAAQSAAASIKEAVASSLQSAAPNAELAFQTPSAAMSRVFAPLHKETSLRVEAPRLGSSQNARQAPVKSVSPVAPANRVSTLLPAAPNTNEIARAGINAPSLANNDRHTSAAESQNLRVVRPGLLGVFASPREMAALQTPAPLNGRLAHLSLRPRRAGNMAARPALTMGMEAQAVEAAPIVAMRPTVKALRAPVKATAIHLTRVPGIQVASVLQAVKTHGIQVAFDNTQIVFDVQPRIQRGLPIAPFRQIFEHTGGTIQWFNQSKTMRAVNSDREIELKVGEDEAKVNNHTVKMEAKSFIEKGRTIVPLSFVRDALNVNVTYDAKTGHLRIDSKK